MPESIQKFTLSAVGNTDIRVPNGNLEGATIYIENDSDGTFYLSASGDAGVTFAPNAGVGMSDENGTAVAVGPSSDDRHVLSGLATNLRLRCHTGYTTGNINVWIMFPAPRSVR